MTSQSENTLNKEIVIEYSKSLKDMLCTHVMTYEISNFCSYADYVIIATTLSDTHRRGIINSMPELFHKVHLDQYAQYCVKRHHTKDAGGWVLVDLNELIVHLMMQDARDFYELEKLWYEVPLLFKSDE